MSLTLHTHARVEGVRAVGLYKVLKPEESARSTLAGDRVLLWEHEGSGYAGSVFAGAPQGDGVTLSGMRDQAVIQPGDVVRVRPGSSLVSVMYRRGSRANTLFATERCNSRCLMCSQPPRVDDDSWRVAELLELVELVDAEEAQLGISGGASRRSWARILGV